MKEEGVQLQASSLTHVHRSNLIRQISQNGVGRFLELYFIVTSTGAANTHELRQVTYE
jgi:hypothetical protein